MYVVEAQVAYFGKKHPKVRTLGSFENEALEKEDRSTKHPNLENEDSKSRKRSTQISLSIINTRPM